MNKLKRNLAAAMALSLMAAAAVSCSNKNNTSSEEQESQVSQIPTEEPTDPNDISGEHITWLADFDINYSANGRKSTAVSIFEDFYGASIEFVRTSYADKYNTLEEMILGGEEVDMFPYEPEAFPNGVIKNYFEPLDPYFDVMGVDEGIWDDMKSVSDTLAYKGEHYVMPYSLSEPSIIIYSRKLMKKEKLDDPYTLYTEGKWDRDAMMKMMEKFAENAEEGEKRYGINGVFGKAALQSSGHTVIGFDGESFSNNIKDDEIKKSEKFMEKIYSSGLYNSSWNDYFKCDGSTLFYAMSDWALGRSNSQNPDADLMIVPFPKAAGAENEYITCEFDARMLVKGSQKGKAVATYLKCERLAASDEGYTKVAKEQAILKEETESGLIMDFMTEEQYDALRSFLDPTVITPVYEPGYGMGEELNGIGDHTVETRGVLDNMSMVFLDGSCSMESWDELCDEWSETVDKQVKKFR